MSYTFRRSNENKLKVYKQNLAYSGKVNVRMLKYDLYYADSYNSLCYLESCVLAVLEHCIFDMYML